MSWNKARANRQSNQTQNNNPVRTNTTNISSKVKVVKPKNKDFGSKVEKNSSKTIEFNEIEDVLAFMWKFKKEIGVSQLIMRITGKNANSVKNSRRSEPFPVKRSFELLGIRKLLREVQKL